MTEKTIRLWDVDVDCLKELECPRCGERFDWNMRTTCPKCDLKIKVKIIDDWLKNNGSGKVKK